MKPLVTLRDALSDDALLGRALPGDSWSAWRTLLLATMGEPLTADELATFRQLTGRDVAPQEPVDEAAFIIGRRGGKDRAVSVLASYIAGLCDHSDVLAPGERGLCVVIGPDQRQSKVQRDYVGGTFESSPMLSSLVVNRTEECIELSNGCAIEVRAAAFRRLRGPTAIAIVATESAFWHSDDSSANTDAEILSAARPMLSTTGGPLICITSPFAKKGEVWNLYRRHYGPKGDPRILVAQGSSRDLNPTLPEHVVQRALERDYAAASAEYLARFRDDIADFVPLEIVEACIDHGVTECAPQPLRRYFGFCDMSGGSVDSATCAIGHREGRMIVVDVLREVPAPHDPESVVSEFASLFRLYGIKRTVGDRYAGQWCAQAFERRGIRYEPCDLPKSALYLDLLPKLNSKTIRLLDNKRATNQLASLQRRTTRGARDVVDHPPNAHDDLANAIAGVASRVAGQRHAPVGVTTRPIINMGVVDGAGYGGEKSTLALIQAMTRH